MADKRIRTKDKGFVGIQLTQDLLEKLDAEVATSTLNRSQVIRLALIEYLQKDK